MDLTDPSEYENSVVIVALPTDDDINHISRLAGEPKDQIHCTVVYAGKGLDEGTIDELRGKVANYAEGMEPFSAKGQGMEQFGDNALAYTLDETPELAGLREAFVEHNASEYTDYRPHISVGYEMDEDDLNEAPPDSVWFDRLGFWNGDNHEEFPLAASAEDALLYSKPIAAAISVDDKWNPKLHPRGKDGRFIEIGGWVKWLNDALKWDVGKVTSIDPTTGEITVEKYTGGGGIQKFPDATKLYHRRRPLAWLKKTPSSYSKSGGAFKKTGGQSGSNTGAMFEAFENLTDAGEPGQINFSGIKKGEKAYVKAAQDPTHARNEKLANELYELAGVPVPEVYIDQDGTTIASKVIDGTVLKKYPQGSPEFEAAAALLRKDMAVDAWIQNWDTVGTGFDNVVVDENGTPWRIDAGGSILFRAMGTPKGKEFGTKVGEIDSMKNSAKNPYAAPVFGTTTDAEITDGVQRIAAISPDKIKELVADLSLDPKVADTLIARRADLMERFDVTPPEALGYSENYSFPTTLTVEKPLPIDGKPVLYPKTMLDDPAVRAEFNKTLADNGLNPLPEPPKIFNPNADAGDVTAAAEVEILTAPAPAPNSKSAQAKYLVTGDKIALVDKGGNAPAPVTALGQEDSFNESFGTIVDKYESPSGKTILSIKADDTERTVDYIVKGDDWFAMQITGWTPAPEEVAPESVEIGSGWKVGVGDQINAIGSSDKSLPWTVTALNPDGSIQVDSPSGENIKFLAENLDGWTKTGGAVDTGQHPYTAVLNGEPVRVGDKIEKPDSGWGGDKAVIKEIYADGAIDATYTSGGFAKITPEGQGTWKKSGGKKADLTPEITEDNVPLADKPHLGEVDIPAPVMVPGLLTWGTDIQPGDGVHVFQIEGAIGISDNTPYEGNISVNGKVTSVSNLGNETHQVDVTLSNGVAVSTIVNDKVNYGTSTNVAIGVPDTPPAAVSHLLDVRGSVSDTHEFMELSKLATPEKPIWIVYPLSKYTAGSGVNKKRLVKVTGWKDYEYGGTYTKGYVQGVAADGKPWSARIGGSPTSLDITTVQPPKGINYFGEPGYNKKPPTLKKTGEIIHLGKVIGTWKKKEWSSGTEFTIKPEYTASGTEYTGTTSTQKALRSFVANTTVMPADGAPTVKAKPSPAADPVKKLLEPTPGSNTSSWVTINNGTIDVGDTGTISGGTESDGTTKYKVDTIQVDPKDPSNSLVYLRNVDTGAIVSVYAKDLSFDKTPPPGSVGSDKNGTPLSVGTKVKWATAPSVEYTISEDNGDGTVTISWTGVDGNTKTATEDKSQLADMYIFSGEAAAPADTTGAPSVGDTIHTKLGSKYDVTWVGDNNFTVTDQETGDEFSLPMSFMQTDVAETVGATVTSPGAPEGPPVATSTEGVPVSVGATVYDQFGNPVVIKEVFPNGNLKMVAANGVETVSSSDNTFWHWARPPKVTLSNGTDVHVGEKLIFNGDEVTIKSFSPNYEKVWVSKGDFDDENLLNKSSLESAGLPAGGLTDVNGDNIAEGEFFKDVAGNPFKVESIDDGLVKVTDVSGSEDAIQGEISIPKDFFGSYTKIDDPWAFTAPIGVDGGTATVKDGETVSAGDKLQLPDNPFGPKITVTSVNPDGSIEITTDNTGSGLHLSAEQAKGWEKAASPPTTQLGGTDVSVGDIVEGPGADGSAVAQYKITDIDDENFITADMIGGATGWLIPKDTTDTYTRVSKKSTAPIIDSTTPLATDSNGEDIYIGDQLAQGGGYNKVTVTDATPGGSLMVTPEPGNSGGDTPFEIHDSDVSTWEKVPPTAVTTPSPDMPEIGAQYKVPGAGTYTIVDYGQDPVDEGGASYVTVTTENGDTQNLNPDFFEDAQKVTVGETVATDKNGNRMKIGDEIYWENDATGTDTDVIYTIEGVSPTGNIKLGWENSVGVHTVLSETPENLADTYTLKPKEVAPPAPTAPVGTLKDGTPLHVGDTVETPSGSKFQIMSEADDYGIVKVKNLDTGNEFNATPSILTDTEGQILAEEVSTPEVDETPLPGTIYQGPYGASLTILNETDAGGGYMVQWSDGTEAYVSKGDLAENYKKIGFGSVPTKAPETPAPEPTPTPLAPKTAADFPVGSLVKDVIHGDSYKISEHLDEYGSIIGINEEDGAMTVFPVGTTYDTGEVGLEDLTLITGPAPAAPAAPTGNKPLSDGSPSEIGAEVVHIKTGLKGTITGHPVTYQGTYATVTLPDGTKKLYSANLLKSANEFTPEGAVPVDINEPTLPTLKGGVVGIPGMKVKTAKGRTGTLLAVYENGKVRIQFDDNGKKGLAAAAATEVTDASFPMTPESIKAMENAEVDKLLAAEDVIGTPTFGEGLTVSTPNGVVLSEGDWVKSPISEIPYQIGPITNEDVTVTELGGTPITLQLMDGETATNFVKIDPPAGATPTLTPLEQAFAMKAKLANGDEVGIGDKLQTKQGSTYIITGMDGKKVDITLEENNGGNLTYNTSALLVKGQVFKQSTKVKDAPAPVGSTVVLENGDVLHVGDTIGNSTGEEAVITGITPTGYLDIEHKLGLKSTVTKEDLGYGGFTKKSGVVDMPGSTPIASYSDGTFATIGDMVTNNSTGSVYIVENVDDNMGIVKLTTPDGNTTSMVPPGDLKNDWTKQGVNPGIPTPPEVIQPTEPAGPPPEGFPDWYTDPDAVGKSAPPLLPKPANAPKPSDGSEAPGVTLPTVTGNTGDFATKPQVGASVAEAMTAVITKKDATDTQPTQQAGFDSDLIYDQQMRFQVVKGPDGKEYLEARFFLMQDHSDGIGTKLLSAKGAKKGGWVAGDAIPAASLTVGDAVRVKVGHKNGNGPAIWKPEGTIGTPNATLTEVSPVFTAPDGFQYVSAKFIGQDGTTGSLDYQVRKEGINTYEWNPDAVMPNSSGYNLSTEAKDAGWSETGKGGLQSAPVDATGKKVYKSAWGTVDQNLIKGNAGHTLTKPLAGGGNVTFTYADPSGGSIGFGQARGATINNEVFVRVPIGDDADMHKGLSEAMESLGVSLDKQKPPTAHDVRTIGIKKLATSLHINTPAAKSATGDPGDQNTAAVLAEAGKKLELGRPMTFDDLAMYTDRDGKPWVGFSTEIAEHITKKQGSAFYTHSSSRLSDADFWAKVMGPSGAGLIPTDLRWSQGIMKNGLSSGTDMTNGSGHGLYVSGGSHYSGPRNVVLSANAGNRRLSIFANSGDGFGKWSTLEWWKTSNPYEYVVKDGFPPEDIGMVITSSAPQIIANMKSKGITEIAGRPIEEIFVKSATTKQAEKALGAMNIDPGVKLSQLSEADLANVAPGGL